MSDYMEPMTPFVSGYLNSILGSQTRKMYRNNKSIQNANYSNIKTTKYP